VREDQLLAGIEVELATLHLDRPSAIEGLMPALHAYLGLENLLVVTPVERSHGGLRLERFHAHAFTDAERVRRRFDQFFRQSPRRYAWYDPTCPEPEQRNTFIDALDLMPPGEFERSMIYAHVLEPLDLHRKRQPRMLLCDGPSLLAWFGSFSDQRATPHQRALLEHAGELLPIAGNPGAPVQPGAQPPRERGYGTYAYHDTQRREHQQVRGLQRCVVTRVPPPQPQQQFPQSVALSAAILDRYAGEYEHVAPGTRVTIRRDGDTLLFDVRDSGRRPLPFGGLPFDLSTAVSAPDPQNIINVVMFGLPPADGELSAVMPAFGAALSDADIAALLQHLRRTFSQLPDWTGLESQAAATRSR
jgi:hypothetical protein